jgi:hypothetical protein
MTLRESRAFLWINRQDNGWTTKKIARYAGVTIRTVQMEIAWVRAQIKAWEAKQKAIRIPRLRLFFPVAGLVPNSACHCTPTNHIPGSKLCCAVCHRSGIDDHPGLQREPILEPHPEPVYRPPATNATKLTRKKRRASSHQSGRTRGIPVIAERTQGTASGAPGSPCESAEAT